MATRQSAGARVPLVLAPSLFAVTGVQITKKRKNAEKIPKWRKEKEERRRGEWRVIKRKETRKEGIER
jgi:hypothetical protein